MRVYECMNVCWSGLRSKCGAWLLVCWWQAKLTPAPAALRLVDMAFQGSGGGQGNPAASGAATNLAIRDQPPGKRTRNSEEEEGCCTRNSCEVRDGQVEATGAHQIHCSKQKTSRLGRIEP